MGRIRTIKPEFFTDADLYDAEKDSGLPLRVAYAGLWTCADREGRFKWRPRELKLAVLPHDQVDFSRVLDALATRGFLVKYASMGDHFGLIPNFGKHQVINHRESESVIPPPQENQIVDACPTRDPRVHDAYPTRPGGKGKEGKENTRVDDALPDWLNAELFAEWEKMRKRIPKAPYTPGVRSRILADLATLQDWGIDPNVRLGEALTKGWRAVKFPDDEKRKKWQWRVGDPNNPADWAAAQLPPEAEL